MISTLEAVGVDFAYDGGPPVLAGISLAIGTGEIVALVGQSGTGKSTLLRLLAGLVEPDAGAVQFRPDTGMALSARGYVPQDYGLLPWLTAEQNTEIALLALNLPKAERRLRCAESLAMVGASAFVRRPVCTLSGGMQQRVAVARALVGKPTVLLLDEPFSSVDWWTRRGLQANLLSLLRTRDLSLLFVTHDVDEALRLADRVVILRGAPARIVRTMAMPIPQSEREKSAHASALAEMRAVLLADMAGSHVALAVDHDAASDTRERR